jgi:hypothetical protein
VPDTGGPALDTATDVVPGADTWVKVRVMPAALPPLTTGDTSMLVPLAVFSEAVELAVGAGVGVAAVAAAMLISIPLTSTVLTATNVQRATK